MLVATMLTWNLAGKFIPTRPTRGLTPLVLYEDRRSETPALKNGTIRGKPTSILDAVEKEEESSNDPFHQEEPLVNFLE